MVFSHSLRRVVMVKKAATITAAFAVAVYFVIGLAVPSGALAAGSVAGWGSNKYGQLDGGATAAGSLTPVQVDLDRVVKLSAGSAHNLALKDDGSVWGWGANGFGELGDGTTTGRSAPVRAEGISEVSAVSAGGGFSLALGRSGRVWCWGANGSGQLGDGTTVSRANPTALSNMSGVTIISAGGAHSLAVGPGHSVYAWGYNAHGQLGDGGTTDSPRPVRVSGSSGMTGAVSVSAGGWHSLAVDGEGHAWGWGYNGGGRLGDGTTTERSAPVRVKVIENVVAVAAGGWHSLALKSDGTVWSWGTNSDGQLGDGTTADRSVPAQVAGLSGVTAIAAGWRHSLALKSDGTVWAWGWNPDGELGNNTTVNSLVPVEVTGLSHASSVSAGSYHSLALDDLTPPVSSITAPASGAVLTGPGVAVSGTSTDGGGVGVAKVEVSTDGAHWFTASDTSEVGSWATWQFGLETPGDGSYTITSRATDKNGNVETPGTGVKVTIDSKPPTTVISSPAPGKVITGDRITVLGSSSDAGGSGVAGAHVSVDKGASWGIATDTSSDGSWSSWSYTLTGPADGLHGVTAYAVDRAGNKGATLPVVDVTVDNTPPDAAITAPATGAHINGKKFTVKGTADDHGGCGVASVEVKAEGGAWAAATDTSTDGSWSTWSFDWNIDAPGPRTLFARATDKAGNVNEAVPSVTVTVDSLLSSTTKSLFTADSDFDIGILDGVEHDTTHDQLQLSATTSALPFIWVPDNDGAVSKVDTRTGREVARYRTAPVGVNSLPSRTTVDLAGDVWLGNRQCGTAVKIGLLENGEYIDRNGDGVIETSTDLNGDGVITPDETLPWGEDECVLYEVVLIPGHEGTYDPGTYPGPYADDYYTPGPRSFAVDAGNNLWVGCYGTKLFYYIDGATGQIMKTVDVSETGHTPYGAVIDANGVLWSSGGGGNNVLRLDPTGPGVPTSTRFDIGHNVYGLAVDYLGHLFISGMDGNLTKIDVTTGAVVWDYSKPEMCGRGAAVTPDNNVWAASSCNNKVVRYDNDGDLVASVPVGNDVTGVSVDAAGKVWAIDNGDEYIRRIDPATNTVDLEVPLAGVGHYGYSDMTGSSSRGISSRVGTWTVIHDGGAANTPWGKLNWTKSEPAGTKLTARVRSSNDMATWSGWEGAVNGAPLRYTPDGRYIEVSVTFQAAGGAPPPGVILAGTVTAPVSPILYDISVTAAATPLASRDTTPPTGSLAINGGAPTTGDTAVTLSFNATDDSGKVARMRLSPDGSSWGGWVAYEPNRPWSFTPGDGMKYVHVMFKDVPGNTSGDIIGSIFLDQNAPASTITDPVAGANIRAASYTVTGTATDGAGAGVGSVKVTWDGGASWTDATDTSRDGSWSTWSATCPVPATLGVYAVMSQATDKAGHVECPNAGVSVRVSQVGGVDTTPPVSTFDAAASGSFVGGPAPGLTGKATDVGLGVQVVEVSADGGALTPATDTSTDGSWSTWRWPFAPLAEGVHTVTSRAIDRAGNVEIPGVGISVTVDTTPPTGSFTINGGQTLTNNPALNLTIDAQDTGSGVDQMAVSVDGTFDTEPWAPYTASAVADLGAGEGLRTVTVRFMDKAGNVSLTPAVSQITIDTVKPVSSVLAPADGEVIGLPGYTITGDASDGAGSGVKEVFVSTDGGETWDKAFGAASWSFPWKPSANGSYLITSRAVDIAGNLGANSAGVSCQVNTTARLDFSSGEAPKGGKVTWAISLTNFAGSSISATSNDLIYDETALSNPTAVIGPAGAAAGKVLNLAMLPGGLCRVGVSSTTNTNAIADGVVALVAFDVVPTTAALSTLVKNSPTALDPASSPVQVGGSDATVKITRKPGDINGDGVVSINEVQSAVNMSLGYAPVDPSVDTDGDGVVSDLELQAVIDAYLGGGSSRLYLPAAAAPAA